MHIDVPQALSHETMIVYEPHHFVMFRAERHGERMEKREYFLPVLETAAGKFADDEGVAGNTAFVQPQSSDNALN